MGIKKLCEKQLEKSGYPKINKRIKEPKEYKKEIEWVNVKDKLPEHGRTVLAAYKNSLDKW